MAFCRTQKGDVNRSQVVLFSLPEERFLYSRQESSESMFNTEKKKDDVRKKPCAANKDLPESCKLQKIYIKM